MAFTRSWNEAQPDGSEAASDIDLEFRKLKEDIRERMEQVSSWGSNTDPMTLDAGGVRARVEKNGTQSIPASTSTVTTFANEEYDDGGMADLGANDDRLTVPAGEGGLYLVVAGVRWAAPAASTTEMHSKIDIGGATLNLVRQHAEADALASNLSALWKISAGTIIQLSVFHDDSGAVDVNANTSLAAVKLGNL